MTPELQHSAESVAPVKPAFVREYLRANLFDGSEDGVLTVPIRDHLDFLVELVIDLFSEIWEIWDDDYDRLEGQPSPLLPQQCGVVRRSWMEAEADGPACTLPMGHDGSHSDGRDDASDGA